MQQLNGSVVYEKTFCCPIKLL